MSNSNIAEMNFASNSILETLESNDVIGNELLVNNMEPQPQFLNSHENSTYEEVFLLGELTAKNLQDNVEEHFPLQESPFITTDKDRLPCLLTHLDDGETVSLVSVNDDASFLVKVAKRTVLFPGKLTKVSLITEHVSSTNLLLLNDKYRNPDIKADNCLVSSHEGRMVVYATTASNQSVTLFPGESFCSACIADNSVTVNETVFMSLLE